MLIYLSTKAGVIAVREDQIHRVSSDGRIYFTDGSAQLDRQGQRNLERASTIVQNQRWRDRWAAKE
jgi:hypothetical protein